MTPKEKAEQLTELMAFWNWNDNDCNYDGAKQCAIITVDKIIEELVHNTESPNRKRLMYWNEVKQEIENL